ncbi:hypothetical protein ACFXTH_041873 [Malus domestica]
MKKGPAAPVAPTCHIGTKPPPPPPYVIGAMGANPLGREFWSCASMNSPVEPLIVFLLLGISVISPLGLAGEVVGIFRVPPTEMAIAGTVPEPVA